MTITGLPNDDYLAIPWAHGQIPWATTRPEIFFFLTKMACRLAEAVNLNMAINDYSEPTKI